MNTLLRSLAVCVLIALPLGAQAAAPALDKTKALNVEDIYKEAQDLGNPYESKGVYGKLSGEPALDVYSFTAPEDGSQTITLLNPVGQSGKQRPILLIADPTDATQDQAIRLPLPAEDYHFSVLTQENGDRLYTERALLQRFSIVGEQQLSLKKDKKYYLIVGEEAGGVGSYAIKFGEYQAWTPLDVLTSFPAWIQIQLDAFGGSSPFSFTLKTVGMLFLLLGLALLTGVFVVQEIFSFIANRNKPAGYLLVRLQPFSRLLIWIALWFMILGGVVAFQHVGLPGLPFVLLLLWIVLLVSFLYQTLVLSRQVADVEVTKREATIPFALRKRWFFSSLVSFFALAAFMVYLGMAVSNGLA